MAATSFAADQSWYFRERSKAKRGFLRGKILRRSTFIVLMTGLILIKFVAPVRPLKHFANIKRFRWIQWRSYW